MISYYTSIILIICISLLILCVLVSENDRISKNHKSVYYLAYLLIALSALMEWAGIHFSGNPDIPVFLLRLIKCMDYILTPLAGGMLVFQMQMKNRVSKALFIVIAFNSLFQLVSLFTGWMTKINPDNTYTHGRLYIVYVGTYVGITILVALQFLIYGKSFRRQNRKSVYAIVVMVFICIFMQEILGHDIRTAYLGLFIGAAFLFIHASEFTQQKADAKLLDQQIKIRTDAMTGLFSRYAYYGALKNYEVAMPTDMVAVSIDINGLKEINDTLGHAAGDELIYGAARCIDKTLGKYGSCYRTGGDEFIVLGSMAKKELEHQLTELMTKAKAWKGEMVKGISLSAGYAMLQEYPGVSCEKLVNESDRRMYEEKKKYYEMSGKQPR